MSWNEPGGDKQDPWKGRNQQNGPPDLDEVIRSLQQKLGGIFGGSGRGGSGGPVPMLGLTVIIIAALVLWCLTGFYIVDEGTQGVVTRFGRYTETTGSGLHWHIPIPIETVTVVDVENQRNLQLGYRTGGRQQAIGTVPREALMLTRDENIVDVRMSVLYQVKDAKDFLFNVKDPAATLKQVTESAERGVIGNSKMDFVLKEGRSEIAAQIKNDVQIILDEYEAGILVTFVNLVDAQPPEEVQASYEDAIKAREDKERLINEAQAYSNDIIPKARGAAARIFQEAEGYKARVVAESTGEASRFSQLLAEYEKAPVITRKRLYIESLEAVLAKTGKVMVDVEGGNNLMYLPLDRLGGSRSVMSDNRQVSNPRVSPQETTTRSSSTTSSRSTSRGRDVRGRE